ncbi:MAG: hypothetical protein KBS86_00135 [Proteobacteria bacterium]|nr:hypothetical protein [Candidatus Enterousia scatequi]
MRKIYTLLFGITISANAMAEVLTGCLPGQQCNLVEGVLYTNTGVIDTGGQFNVISGKSVQVQNSGTIKNVFYIQDVAFLTQVIKSNNDVTVLPVSVIDNGRFDLLIDGNNNVTNPISLARIVAVSDKADTIQINNMTYLSLDSGFNSGGLKGKTINVANGDLVWIDIADDFNNFDSPIFYNNTFNINNMPKVISSDTLASLFYFSASEHDGALYISRQRATNYTNILNNKMGAFLDDIRRDNPNDALLRRLDSAVSLGEIDDIIKSAARLNPINLMDSVHAINMFNINDLQHLGAGFRFMLKPVFVFGSGFQSVGGKMSVSSDVSDKLYIALSGYGYKSFYDKDADNYDVMTFGGDLRLDYVGDNIFVHGMAGANINNFSVESVFDGDGSTDNPSGHSFYAYADGGYKFVLSDDISLRMFGGVGMDTLSILNDKKNNLFGRAGSDISYDIKTGDVVYEYDGRISINTFGYLDAALGANVWLNSDDAGGGISVSVSDSDLGWIGKVSANVRLLF